MPGTVVICSFGGSLEPIEASLLQRKPALALFFASRESVEHVGVLKARLAAKGFEVRNVNEVVPDKDDLDGCFEQALQLERQVADAEPDEVVVDFTGGTKAMTAALALASARWRLPVRYGYVAGAARNKGGLGTVVTGTEIVHTADSPLRKRGLDALREVALHANAYRFAAASLVATAALPAMLPGPEKALFTALEKALAGYEAWERFDHKAATIKLHQAAADLGRHLQYRRDRALSEYARGLGENCSFLENVQKKTLQWKRLHWILVADLLANAERRAEEGRFDDAVARLYRAIEMAAQVAFEHRFEVATGAVPPALVPASLREEYERRYKSPGKELLELPLFAAFRMLAAVEDPLGAKFAAHQEALLGLLAARNNSILAHGRMPIAEGTCREMASLVIRFLPEEATALPRFPRLVAP